MSQRNLIDSVCLACFPRHQRGRAEGAITGLEAMASATSHHLGSGLLVKGGGLNTSTGCPTHFYIPLNEAVNAMLREKVTIVL